MKLLTEKEASIFLKKEGFKTNQYVYVEKLSDLKNAVDKIGFPCVIKVSGHKIVHKTRLGGVQMDIGNYSEAVSVFKKFMKIKNAEGVIIQKQIPGEWFLLGVKKTPEFGHAIAFGAGGIYTEQIKDISFRIYPLTKTDAIDMINDTKISQKISIKDRKTLKDNLLKLCKLIKKYPEIKELDINPLMIYRGRGLIIDSRIIFED